METGVQLGAAASRWGWGSCSFCFRHGVGLHKISRFFWEKFQIIMQFRRKSEKIHIMKKIFYKKTENFGKEVINIMKNYSINNGFVSLYI